MSRPALTITLLSTLRTFVGASLLLFPSMSANAFFLPSLTSSAAGTTIVTRLAGSRDLVLGLGTLYIARQTGNKFAAATPNPILGEEERTGLLDASPGVKKDGHEGVKFDRDTVRTVLYGNIAVDAIDVLSCLYCLVGERIGLEAFGLVGGGAVLFLGLGVGAVMGMRKV